MKNFQELTITNTGLTFWMTLSLWNDPPTQKFEPTNNMWPFYEIGIFLPLRLSLYSEFDCHPKINFHPQNMSYPQTDFYPNTIFLFNTNFTLTTFSTLAPTLFLFSVVEHHELATCSNSFTNSMSTVNIQRLVFHLTLFSSQMVKHRVMIKKIWKNGQRFWRE